MPGSKKAEAKLKARRAAFGVKAKSSNKSEGGLREPGSQNRHKQR